MLVAATELPTSPSNAPVATFKKRAAKSKLAAPKRKALPAEAVAEDDESFSSDDGSDRDGRNVKRLKKVVGVTATSTSSQAQVEPLVQANATAGHSYTTNDATKSTNWFDQDNDHLRSTSSHWSVKGGSSKSATSQEKSNTSRQVGPVKSSTNVRTITVTDFAPDVCKDYKQTGFCGFGDSCKFLHAREDYKQGWELDRDWEIGTKGKRVQGKTVASANRSKGVGRDDEDDEGILEDIPFACIICKQPYQNPIVTKCGHYFCEACALKRYRQNPACAACGASTGGVFNVARKLTTLLAKKEERAKRRGHEESAITTEL